MKKIVSIVAVVLCLMAMVVPAYAVGEELGHDTPSAGYAHTDPNKQTKLRAAGYTYLWDLTVGSLGPGNLLTTVSGSKKIDSKYSSVQVSGSVIDYGKVGACYLDSSSVWKDIGSAKTEKSTVSFTVKHVSGKTTRGFFKNTSSGRWDYVDDETYTFSAK